LRKRIRVSVSGKSFKTNKSWNKPPENIKLNLKQNVALMYQ
jgi:hypothetical protein